MPGDYNSVYRENYQGRECIKNFAILPLHNLSVVEGIPFVGRTEKQD